MKADFSRIDRSFRPGLQRIERIGRQSRRDYRRHRDRMDNCPALVSEFNDASGQAFKRLREASDHALHQLE
jgi:hypothetical protein